MSNCLYCYKPLEGGETDFHPACSRKMFGTAIPPVFPYSEDQIGELGLQAIKSQLAVTGVQPKLSLNLEPAKNKQAPQRFTIVGLWGGYILKPPTPDYEQLPEVEDLTMHLAQAAKITTVPHSLIRMKSDHLAYVTRRVDRTRTGKLHMEDMCQLTEKLTEDKYRGSYEQVGKAILKYSAQPGLDVVNFCEQVLFSFLTGNADMHLKNFSLINQPGIGYCLTPAYDLVSTALVYPADDEDLALTLNGKKKKIKLQDFTTAFTTLRLDDRQQKNLFHRMTTALPAWMDRIERSFLSDDMKQAYKELMQQKHQQLFPQE